MVLRTGVAPAFNRGVSPDAPRSCQNPVLLLPKLQNA
jgi:hypothetical protein